MKRVSLVGFLMFLASSGIPAVVEAFSNPRLAAGSNNKAHVALALQKESSTSSSSSSVRRELFENTVTSIVGVTGAFILPGLVASTTTALTPQSASASGGATAGKYTTIPIAKRRYYGRVQFSVHEFLLIGPEVVQADFSAPKIRGFFDTNGLVVVEAKRTDVNGQCTKKNGDCKGQEIRDSQWNDMKTSMYLLANAFRLNQTKAPDNLPSVRAAKRFFKEMDFVEKAAKKGRKNDKDTVVHYAAALDALDEFLDLVELPPTDSGWYDQIFDRAVSKVRIT